MSIKKKIFISYNYKDNAKVNLLKGQLANSLEIDATFVSEATSSSEKIKVNGGRATETS